MVRVQASWCKLSIVLNTRLGKLTRESVSFCVCPLFVSLVSGLQLCSKSFLPGCCIFFLFALRCYVEASSGQREKLIDVVPFGEQRACARVGQRAFARRGAALSTSNSKPQAARQSKQVLEKTPPSWCGLFGRVSPVESFVRLHSDDKNGGKIAK